MQKVPVPEHLTDAYMKKHGPFDPARPQPVTRNYELASLFHQIAQQLQYAHAPFNVELQRSCLSCCHFDEPSEQCRKFQSRPPARVIAYGCGEYADECEIPY